MIYKCFTRKFEELDTFLDQTNNAYKLCDPSLHSVLLILFFNAIEGEPYEKLRASKSGHISETI